MKTQKGITLIALIITIIVMLILVGVTVSIALNSGLFKATQGAAKNTEAERINETKLSTGKVNIGGEEVDITNTANINAYLDKQKLKEQGYTHKLTCKYGQQTFECYVKENTTFEQLDALYDEISVDEDGYTTVFGLWIRTFFNYYKEDFTERYELGIYNAKNADTITYFFKGDYWYDSIQPPEGYTARFTLSRLIEDWNGDSDTYVGEVTFEAIS